MSLYLHRLPGRLRLRAGSLARHPRRLERIRADLADLPGVRRIEINPHAGSVTIFHDDARLDAEAILERLVVGGLLEAPAVPTPHTRPGPSLPVASASAAKLGSLFGKALFDAMLHKGVERSVRLLLGR